MWNGKKKALTFSYDDGVTQDRRLIGILNRYGLRATFNLNSGLFGEAQSFYDAGKDVTFGHVRLRASEIPRVYAGHEIAVHTRTHPNLRELADEQIRREIADDRAALSALAGYDVRGMAYPVGSRGVDARTRRIARQCGIAYARCTTSTHAFDLPEDPLWLCPTVRHAEWDAMTALAVRFLAMEPDKPQVFFIWGHAYEFERDDDWARFEAFCRLVSGREDIFYGTNGEIFL